MKKIIIIGATSGIGYETARIYLEKGYLVGVAGRRTERLEQLIQEFPDRCFPERIDITSADASEGLLNLITRMGGMDLFLLCSGIGKQNKELDPEIEINTVETNAVGFTRMTTAAFAYFREQKKGHLAVISSIAGTKGIGLAPSYSATKRFQNTYMEALEQLARKERLAINFTDIRPGFVDTELLAKRNYPMLMNSKKTADSITQALSKKKRVAIIDNRYRILTCFWSLIPKWLWVRIPL